MYIKSKTDNQIRKKKNVGWGLGFVHWLLIGWRHTWMWYCSRLCKKKGEFKRAKWLEKFDTSTKWSLLFHWKIRLWHRL